MREGNIIKRSLAAVLTCVIVFTGGIGITARRALAYNAGVEAFVNSLYSDCLGRTADPAGKAYWLGQISQIDYMGDILLKNRVMLSLNRD